MHLLAKHDDAIKKVTNIIRIVSTQANQKEPLLPHSIPLHPWDKAGAQ